MNIVQQMHHKELFADSFPGNSWSAWEVFLKSLFTLPLNAADRQIYFQHTQRETLPSGPIREAWLVVGRRGGKSQIASLIATHLAVERDFRRYLKPGEMGVISVLAADRRQARIILRHIKGFFRKPTLAVMVEKEMDESIELKNGIVIEVMTASFRTTRGYSLCAVIAEEIAFWRSDESANPDKEIIRALRPGLATIPNSLFLAISSPYSRRGMLWETYQKHFGKDSEDTLVWQGTTQEMHPGNKDLDRDVSRLLEEDPASARAEYMAEFRVDVETFVSLEAVQACTMQGRLESPHQRKFDYFGFTDPSGGSNDSMTLGIAHRETEGERVKAVLDCVREWKAPFNPDEVVAECAKVLDSYGLAKTTGDRYAGGWVPESFRRHGITYVPSEQSRSEIYSELLPLLNSKRVELLDIPRLANQLVNLERRTGSGRDVIDHGPGQHDDLANSAAGALVLAARKPSSSGLYF